MMRSAKFFRLVKGILRELSDEAAYSRHLRATGRAHSSAEWRLFTEGRYRRKFQSAKCC